MIAALISAITRAQHKHFQYQKGKCMKRKCKVLQKLHFSHMGIATSATVNNHIEHILFCGLFLPDYFYRPWTTSAAATFQHQHSANAIGMCFIRIDCDTIQQYFLLGSSVPVLVDTCGQWEYAKLSGFCVSKTLTFHVVVEWKMSPIKYIWLLHTASFGFSDLCLQQHGLLELCALNSLHVYSIWKCPEWKTAQLPLLHWAIQFFSHCNIRPPTFFYFSSSLLLLRSLSLSHFFFLLHLNRAIFSFGIR